MTKNKTKKEIKITHDDLKFIYGNEYVLLQEKIIPNCFCTNCPPPTKYGATIIDYEIFLNDLNDTILRGFCSVCKNPIGRYVETGEVEEFAKRIKDIRKKYG